MKIWSDKLWLKHSLLPSSSLHLRSLKFVKPLKKPCKTWEKRHSMLDRALTTKWKVIVDSQATTLST